MDVFTINDSSPVQLIIKSVEGGSLLKGEDTSEKKPARASSHWPLCLRPSFTEDSFLFAIKETFN